MADDEGDVDAADGEDDAPADGSGRRRPLDGRTLAICALVAVIAALLAGFVTSRVTADDGDEPATEGTLVPAEEAPDLVLARLGGGDDVRIADYRGQPVVVNFWGSWCVPCVEEMPDLQRVHESLGDQVAFLGVNVNDAPEAATEMVARTGVTYDLVRDEDGALGRALEVTTFPTTFLIDADGTIVDVSKREISAERLCEKINQSLLNQSLGAGECG
ncbi:MAG TPA: TlpA disulfide reductase family protein [Iamia sp.]|jgi:thiol-disulfide isomerase/thioredoxin|nr:TlpA disulfide reductase family protein [Iamia sp.]